MSYLDVSTFWDEEKQQSELRVGPHALVGTNEATFAVMDLIGNLRNERKRMLSEFFRIYREVEKMELAMLSAMEWEGAP